MGATQVQLPELPGPPRRGQGRIPRDRHPNAELRMPELRAPVGRPEALAAARDPALVPVRRVLRCAPARLPVAREGPEAQAGGS